MRIYYIGGEDRHQDRRLPGIVLNFGDAVDVHGGDLAEELLALRHFALQPGPAQVVEDTPYEETPVALSSETPGEDEEAGGDVEVADYDNS